MRYSLRPLLASGLVFFFVGHAASAHHSFAAYDRNKSYRISGVVKSFEWTNPHSWLRIVAEGTDGKPKQWDIESGAPNVSIRLGWRADDIKAGDRVTLVFNPMRNNTPSGTLAYVVLANGRLLPGNAGAPGKVISTRNDLEALLASVAPAPGWKVAQTLPKATGLGVAAVAPAPQAKGGTATGFVPAMLRPYLVPIPPGYPAPAADPRSIAGTYVHAEMISSGGVDQLPLRAAALAQVREREQARKFGRPIANLSELCRPPGMVTEMSLNFPFSIIQNREQVLIIFEEYHSVMRIRLNEDMPSKVPVSYEGYSVGRWDGDKLIVQTRGIDTRTTLSMNGAPHSDALRQTMVIRKLNSGRNLEFTFTFDDTKSYTKPWSAKPIVVNWRPDYSHFAEYNCEETIGSADAPSQYGLRLQ